jgi:hypothetical protein
MLIIFVSETTIKKGGNMWHITSLGGDARQFFNSVVDIDGYVPEEGDDWLDMRWDFGSDCPIRAQREIEDMKNEYTVLTEEAANKDVLKKLADEIEKAQSDRDELYSYLTKEWFPEKIREAQRLLKEWNDAV